MEKDSATSGVRPDYDDEIDLRELFATLWAGKTTIFGAVVLAGLLSIFVALQVPNKFTSEALLAPREAGGTGGALGQMASQFGGIASFAGVNLTGLGGQSDAVVAVEMLKSREFFRTYLYEAVLVDLMASKGLDPDSGELIFDEGVYDTGSGKWLKVSSEKASGQPSVQEAFRAFNSGLTVSKDNSTGFITVAVTHYSPIVARDWVALIVSSINEALRSRDVREAENSITFLNQQIAKTNLLSLQEGFADLIEQQTKTVTLANASDEYVFRVIEPPVAPELKSEPRRALICVLGTIAGGALAVLWILVLRYARTETTRK